MVYWEQVFRFKGMLITLQYVCVCHAAGRRIKSQYIVSFSGWQLFWDVIMWIQFVTELEREERGSGEMKGGDGWSFSAAVIIISSSASQQLHAEHNVFRFCYYVTKLTLLTWRAVRSKHYVTLGLTRDANPRSPGSRSAPASSRSGPFSLLILRHLTFCFSVAFTSKSSGEKLNADGVKSHKKRKQGVLCPELFLF